MSDDQTQPPERGDFLSRATIDVRITHYEAEVLWRHWFERMRYTQELNYFYETYGSGDAEEWEMSIDRRAALAPYVSEAFLAAMGEEARRRNAETEAAGRAYDREEYHRDPEAEPAGPLDAV